MWILLRLSFTVGDPMLLNKNTKQILLRANHILLTYAERKHLSHLIPQGVLVQCLFDYYPEGECFKEHTIRKRVFLNSRYEVQLYSTGLIHKGRQNKTKILQSKNEKFTVYDSDASNIYHPTKGTWLLINSNENRHLNTILNIVKEVEILWRVRLDHINWPPTTKYGLHMDSLWMNLAKETPNIEELLIDYLVTEEDSQIRFGFNIEDTL
jgi:hypothetical protein